MEGKRKYFSNSRINHFSNDIGGNKSLCGYFPTNIAAIHLNCSSLFIPAIVYPKNGVSFDLQNKKHLFHYLINNG